VAETVAAGLHDLFTYPTTAAQPWLSGLWIDKSVDMHNSNLARLAAETPEAVTRPSNAHFISYTNPLSMGRKVSKSGMLIPVTGIV
jgi:hypothetical protein